MTICEACQYKDERFPHTYDRFCNQGIKSKPGKPPRAKPDGSDQADCSSDAVHSPSHYMMFTNLESIEVIARTMTVSEFRGFCLGNVLKYHLRAGKKADLANMEQDLKKAEFYKKLFEKHKGLCYE